MLNEDKLAHQSSVKFEQYAYGLAWIAFLYTLFLQFFKLDMQSDSLFLEYLFRDVFAQGHAWSDWRLTPAPAYFPDILLYSFAWKLLPTAPLRMFFVTAMHGILLIWVLLWLAKKITAVQRITEISLRSKTLIFLALSSYQLAAANSKMWLYFNTTNNHLSSLLCSLFLTGIAFEILKKPTPLFILIFACASIAAKLSSAVILICFIAPLCVFLTLFYASGFYIESIQKYQKNTILLFSTVVLSQLIAAVIEPFISLNDPMRMRGMRSIESTIHSFKITILATMNVFGIENISTCIVSLSTLAAFLFLCHTLLNPIERYLRNTGFLPKEWLKSINQWIQETPSHIQIFWGFFLFWLVVCTVNIGGCIASGAMIDINSYRYFMFLIAFGISLFICFLDLSQHTLLPQKKSIPINTLQINTLQLLSGTVIFILISIAYTPLIWAESSKNASLSDIANNGNGPESELPACIEQLEKKGVSLHDGIGDYWLVRGVHYFLKTPHEILYVQETLESKYWMDTIAPIKHPEQYPPRHYNFVLLPYDLRKKYDDQLSIQLMRAHLPAGYTRHVCEQKTAEIWVYSDNALHDAVVQGVQKTVYEYGGAPSFTILGRNMMIAAGRVQGESLVIDTKTDALLTDTIVQKKNLTGSTFIDLPQGKHRVTVAYTVENSDANTQLFLQFGRFSPASRQKTLHEGFLSLQQQEYSFTVDIPRGGMVHAVLNLYGEGSARFSLSHVTFQHL